MPDLWKKRDQNFFAYDGGETIKTAEAGNRTLNDWNRCIKSGEKCPYYIDGIKLSDLRATMLVNGDCSQLEFADTAEMKAFFKTYLFKGLSSEQADIAAVQATLQFHQAGIQHATYQYASALVQEKFTDMKVAEPKYTVHFHSSDEGVSITETNEYREWVEVPTTGSIKRHTRPEHKEPYAVSTTVYSFTPDSITLKDLIIDCPSTQMTKVFGEGSEEAQALRGSEFWRALLEWSDILRFIARFYSGVTESNYEDTKAEDRIVFEHPKLK